ncbi:hypothetical protein BC835DRAFT_198827 [Cytidiella melzeri]|nr:hypothetical protein BC835DRAFT_198827 [Cytidiella melzeri]
MFSKFNVAFVTLAVLSALENVTARYVVLERDGRHLSIIGRSFGNEHPAVIDQLAAACPGQVCGVLSGQAITPLLAAQGECTQQDMADAIIDAAQQFDDPTKSNMIQLAIVYRQAEKNTPPDFTTNPPTQRNSVFCQKAPKNAELNNLVQAQDPSNDPNVFFDPATGKSVQKGAQANTSPFVVSGSSAANSTGTAATSVALIESATASAAPSSVVVLSSSASLVTATAASADPCVVTVTVTGDAAATSVAVTPAASETSSAAVATSTASSSSIGNFGSCTVPQIEFGAGFDGRKETSFQPVDKTSFNHGSAQGIDIITKFICDTLTNSCGADQTAKDTCAKAEAAADAQTAKTGAQADAFNAVFGITTDFAAVTALDDQGAPIAGTGASAGATSVEAVATTTSAAAAAAATSAAASGASSSSIGDFGSCTVPQIEFGVGFDNRKETSFQPVDKTSFNHGSAQNIDIITQFICDTLTNSCKADQTAKDTCATAKAAADAQPPKTGAQADAFNAAFNIKTDFAAVAAVDDQGNVVAGTGASAAAASAAVSTASVADVATSVATSSAAAATSAAATSSSAGIGNFGKCSVPKINFGVGFDNRKETSFEPADQVSYVHGSADNGDIITQFMCDNLVNVCGADATAKATCAQAKVAFDSKTAKTGAQADAFNAVFGITTNFASITPLDNQGKPVVAA